jgi:hypothetical protein
MSDDPKVKKEPPSEAAMRDSKAEEKGAQEKLGFTEEQYEHFKFGLIKRNGERVPDYEKKLAHYEAYVARGRKRKGAA